MNMEAKIFFIFNGLEISNTFEFEILLLHKYATGGYKGHKTFFGVF
jgi:hypothetical protein